MKKLISVFGGVFVFLSLLSSDAKAFSDISRGSTLSPIVQNLIDRGVIKDGAFFRPNANIPAGMFWEAVMLDSGFDSNLFDPETAQLPPNISSNDDLAPFIAEAIDQGVY